MQGSPVAESLARSDTRIAITGASSWLGLATLSLLEEIFGDRLAERVALFASSARPLTLASGRVLPMQALDDIQNLPEAPWLFLHYAFVTKGHVGAFSLADYAARNRAIADTVETAARRAAARGFFLPSSGAVYRSDHTLRQSLEEHPYGFLKLEDERRFAAMCGEIGCRLSSIRVFNLAGPCINNLDGFALSSIIVSILRGEPVRLRANRPVWRSYVHIMDLLELALAELQNGSSPLCYDTAGETVIEVSQLAGLIAGVMGRPGYPVERPALTEPEDRYVGDGAEFQRRARSHGINLKPLAAQIRDTVADLEPRIGPKA